MEVQLGVGYAAYLINFENQTHNSTCVETNATVIMIWCNAIDIGVMEKT